MHASLPGSAILAGGVGSFGMRLGALRGLFGPCPGWMGRRVYPPEAPWGLGWGMAGHGFPGLSAAHLGPWAHPLGLRPDRWGSTRRRQVLLGRRAPLLGPR